SQIPDVERDPEPICNASRVAGVFEGAAAAGGLTQSRRVLAQRKVDTDDVVSGIEHPRRRDRGVHSSTHGGDDSHAPTPPTAYAARALGTHDARAARAATTSAAVLDRP